MKAARERLTAIWHLDEPDVVDAVNEILADAGIDADGDGDVEPDDADENPSAR